MEILILIIIVSVIIILIIKTIIGEQNKKYFDFVKNNSVTLKKLLEINKTYSFNVLKNYDVFYTYDNETFYNNISCIDYLIYILNLSQYDIKKQIILANGNKVNFELYLEKINNIKNFGKYLNNYGKYDFNKLVSIEKQLYNEYTLKPDISYTIKIKLCRSDIRGYIFESKVNIFNETKILDYIKRLNDKRGTFYNDREIWNALCRVERGKVSNKMRFFIYSRDNYRCKLCGRSERQDYLEIDHIKPISKGGKSTLDNLQTLCRTCNKQKGNKYYG